MFVFDYASQRDQLLSKDTHICDRNRIIIDFPLFHFNKKTNDVVLRKGKQVLVHKSYTDDGKLRMIIVKDQWTAILANFVRK